jgi:stress-induced morphogen
MESQEIKTRLVTKLPAAESDVEVIDLTGGGDHWEVIVRSPAFEGVSRIQRQRMVMAIFDAELKTGEVHALAIKALAPND